MYYTVKDRWGCVIATFTTREQAEEYCDKLNRNAAACHAAVYEE